MDLDSEVLIVGAGPTGLTMAIELVRRGIDARIVDRAERVNPHSKAVILWPRALEVFARLGAIDRILDLAVPVTAANYYSGGRRIARVNFSGLIGSRFGTPLSLPQNDAEAVLRDVLRSLGSHPENGYRLDGIRQFEDGVVAELSGQRHQSSWLIGCDGAHSAVRSAVDVPFTGATYPQSFVLTDGLWDTPLSHGESHYFMGSSGVLVVVGLPGGRYRVFGSVAPELAVEDAEEMVCSIAAERSPVPLRLCESTGSGLFQVQRRIADRFRMGKVLLAGDAAHVHSPAGGQGLNTSIQDAHEAAWRLAAVLRGRMSDLEIDQWERERRHVAGVVVADTDRQTRLWTVDGWRERARDMLVWAAERTGVLDRILPPRLAQMDLAYPADGPGLDALAPGLRVPDVLLSLDTSLHELLRAGAHLMLVFPDHECYYEFPGAGWLRRYNAEVVSYSALNTAPGPSLDIGESMARDGVIVVVIDELDSSARATLGIRAPGAILVRPDGVVAVAGLLTDATLLGRIEIALPRPVPSSGTSTCARHPRRSSPTTNNHRSD